MRELTDRQRKFVDNIVKGMSQRQAYMDAYPSSRKWRSEAVDTQASILRANSKVSNRIEELQNRRTNAALLTREKKRKLLDEFANNEELAVSDRMKAIDIDNKMQNEYTTKVEISKSIDESVKELEEYIDKRRKRAGGFDL